MVIQEVSFRQEVLTFTAQSRPAATASPCKCSDSVSISPEARSATKADALAAALDADKDGAISSEEFVDGGTALLRRAAHRRRSQDDESGDGVHRGHGHGSHRFERRLERAFDKLDANGDGSLDVEELSHALSTVRSRRQPAEDPAAPPPPAATPAEEQNPASTTPADDAGAASPVPSVVSATFKFTFIAIAVRQYQVPDQNLAPVPHQLNASA
jgi:hypothetical protein